MSETNSDCTGGIACSRGGCEDLYHVMAYLGIPTPDLLAQDRFKIDRKLLENLMFGGERNTASELFLNIMRETRTHILWPTKLKLDAKSKKNPHVRIIGRESDIKLARERILSVLGLEGHRVMLRINVSYTDHSHIIGKGGLTIKKVMDDTGCHIHFPDSNKGNICEKNNQVSIAGDINSVEKARARVRKLTPLVFCFHLPMFHSMAPNTPERSTSSPQVNAIQKKYNVQVKYKTTQKLNSTLVEVKGCEWEVENVKTATSLLMKHLCPAFSDIKSVQIMMEISPHYHNEIMGKNKENLMRIMANTNTQILFIDSDDPNIPSFKKSNVTITGSINNVYLARQQIIGLLPVVFRFELPYNTSLLFGTEKISSIMNKHNVLITTRYKPSLDVIKVIIKGIERDIGDVYEAHRKLIGSFYPPIRAEIPESYFFPTISNGDKLDFMDKWKIPTFESNEKLFSISNPCVNSIWSQHPYFTHEKILPPLLSVRSSCSDLEYFSCNSTSLPDVTAYSSLSSNASSICGSRPTLPVYHSREEKKLNNVQDSCLKPDRPKIPPGFKRSTLKQLKGDFDKVKTEAMKAMSKFSTRKIPTLDCYNYNLSQSMPTIQQDLDETRKDELDCSSQPPSECNNLESIPQITLSPMNNLSKCDLPSILSRAGLGKYTSLFDSQEIDLMAFRTLNEDDLKEIGVNALGARRKLVMYITELNKLFGEEPQASTLGSDCNNNL